MKKALIVGITSRRRWFCCWGDIGKGKKVLHWKPKVGFRQLAQMMTD